MEAEQSLATLEEAILRRRSVVNEEDEEYRTSVRIQQVTRQKSLAHFNIVLTPPDDKKRDEKKTKGFSRSRLKYLTGLWKSKAASQSDNSYQVSHSVTQ